MTPISQSDRVVLVAVDASPRSLAALQAAAEAAARLHAELRGMYVEDIDLLRTAELPFACAIASSGQSHPLTSEAMQRQLRRHADMARNAVEAAGVRSNIAWSFSVVRGTVCREIERAASTAVFVTLGRSGWSPKTADEVGSVVRSLATTGSSSLLMVGEGGIRDPVAVVYDGTPSSERAFALAAALDGGPSRPFTVFLTGGSAESLERAGIQAHFRIVSTDPTILTDSLMRSGARTVFLPAKTFAESAEVRRILNERNLSVFLVR